MLFNIKNFFIIQTITGCVYEGVRYYEEAGKGRGGRGTSLDGRDALLYTDLKNTGKTGKV